MTDKAEIAEENSEISEDTIKAKLELEKLNLEIQDLRRDWWKKPAYIAALFPTFLALLTLVYGFSNGYFQAMAVKLENQKYDLQKDVEKLNKDKEILEGQKIDLEDKIKFYTTEAVRQKEIN